METAIAEPASRKAPSHGQTVVNDFNIQVATANGTGSQSSNLVLMRSIFQMGIPVSGKNLFPSNIQGLPTWFTIRVNKNGYIARRERIDILVALNPETAFEDVTKIDAGAAVVYNEPMKLDRLRDDVIFYSVPFDDLVKEVCPVAKLRKLVRNMIYDGVLAFLFDIEMPEIENALNKQFKSKPKAAKLNWDAAQAGFTYAKENLKKQHPYRVERMNQTEGKIIIDGNSAAALGCVMAGATVATWYPITPSSSLCEAMIDYMQKGRLDSETGKATFAIVQAEDELAAVGMAIGAGWAGARAMTATSGPGISLMSEFIGLGYYAEIPCVIFDIQRVGPSTGLPTRTMQGDLLSTAFASHGDTKHPMLIPCSVEECYAMAMTAFDLAEDLQTPVFVMSDLDLGMNLWMSDPFKYPTKPISRGKVLDDEALKKVEEFARYRDVDGDGIPYRTLPAMSDNPKAPYFTRGSGHNDHAGYSERPDDYRNNMDRLARKFATAAERVPAPKIETVKGARIGIIGYGTSHWAILEARDRMHAELNLNTSYLRLLAYPFNSEVHKFIDSYDRVYVIDQNRDAQMQKLLIIDSDPAVAVRIRSVRLYDGLPISPRAIVEQIKSQENLSENGSHS